MGSILNSRPRAAMIASMDSTTLAGKNALVTGAGRGIGKGCALELARRGAAIVANDRPESADLTGTLKEIAQLGRKATSVEADVFSQEGCEALVAAALKEVGPIDVLVSNPALNARSQFLDYKPADFERVLNATLVSGFHLSQLVARHMSEHDGGKIIFISSIHAPVPYVGSIAYNAAKAGLNNMARTMAMELTAHHINVNVVEPGWIDTPGERKAFGDDPVDQGGASVPWGRLGLPADIGNAVAFLASNEADYITAAVLRVDGGLSLKNSLSET